MTGAALVPVSALVGAILFEVVATSTLSKADGFRRWRPAALALLGYAISFYLLSVTFRTLPVGPTYAIWAGAGIVLIVLIGRYWLGQTLDLAGFLGIGMILIGIVILNTLSASLTH